MNYRQWKKNYKKRHGHNPPIEDDKRKQRKAATKALKSINIDELANTIRNAFSCFFDALGNALAMTSESAHRIAQGMRIEENMTELIEENQHEEAIATAGYAEKGETKQ